MLSCTRLHINLLHYGSLWHTAVWKHRGSKTSVCSQAYTFMMLHSSADIGKLIYKCLDTYMPCIFNFLAFHFSLITLGNWFWSVCHMLIMSAVSVDQLGLHGPCQLNATWNRRRLHVFSSYSEEQIRSLRQIHMSLTWQEKMQLVTKGKFQWFLLKPPPFCCLYTSHSDK